MEGAPGAHPERAGRMGLVGIESIRAPGRRGCPGWGGEVKEQIYQEDLGESPLGGSA